MNDGRATILVIDDEPQIRRFLRISLAAEGFCVLEAANGAEGILQFTDRHPDLVILDLGLPDMDGFEVVKYIRSQGQSGTPILILSVRGSEGEKVRLLNSSVYDYVVKPFHTGELLARVRVGLRTFTTRAQMPPVIRFGNVSFDLVGQTLTVEGHARRLSKREFELLRLFTTHPGHVLTHERLMADLWGQVDENKRRDLRVIVGQLRRKLGDDPFNPHFILTEPAVGYRFSASPI